VVFFQCAGVVFGLYGRAALAEDAALDSAEGSGFRGVALAYNTRSKDELNAVLALAARAGGGSLQNLRRGVLGWVFRLFR